MRRQKWGVIGLAAMLGIAALGCGEKKTEQDNGTDNPGWYMQYMDGWLYYNAERESLRRVNCESGEEEPVAEDVRAEYFITEDGLYAGAADGVGVFDGSGVKVWESAPGETVRLMMGNGIITGSYLGDSAENFGKGYLIAYRLQDAGCGYIRKDAMYVQKMAAGENTVMLFGYRGGETAASLIDKMSGEELTVPVENPAAVAVAEKDSYWINTCENGQYCFRLYDAGTGEISEAYDSNFTYGMSDISYDKSEGSLYGYLVMGQYVKFSPKDPKVAARYTAVNIEDADEKDAEVFRNIEGLSEPYWEDGTVYVHILDRKGRNGGDWVYIADAGKQCSFQVFRG